MGSASLNVVEETNVWADLENAFLHHELATIKVEMEIMAHQYDMMRRMKDVYQQYFNELLAERNALLAKRNMWQLQAKE